MYPIKPIAIIGGGPAGLTAAAFLQRHNMPFVLYEAGPKVAGLATSFHDSDGFTYDFGAHFINNRLAAALGVGAQCRTVKYYGESVYIKGQTRGYPLGLLQSPRYVASGIASRFSPGSRQRQFSSAAAWFRSAYGNALANEVALPLLEAWSGVPAADLSASVGSDKLQNSIAQTLLFRAAARLTGRAVTCGYSHEIPETSHVWHVYPEGGVGLLCRKIADGLESNIRLNSPVEAVWVEDNQVKAIQVNGQEQPVSGVISTAPCHILSRMMRGTDRLAALAQFRYRPMVFVNLRLEGRGLLKDTVVWLPEKDFTTFRVTETPISMPWLAPAGKTLITVDIGCEKGDALWSMDDEALGEICLKDLQHLIPDIRQRYRGCRVLRTPCAYPVYLNAYEDVRRQWEQTTGVEGLYTVGRNGEFSHALMEDVYWRTQRKLRKILQSDRRLSTLTMAPAM